ncbi:MAG TPA: dockerin type I domain-containing protein [Pseudobacteroides sp.]|uniref:dockerin type I domain-containing protein n=1 Tax=Pseudobacteroides sp. TaxID=1968840 RepID=UPI002F928496
MKTNIRKLLIFILILVVAVTSSINFTVITQAASDVTVNLSAQKQVIRGFGGINFPTWIDDLTESQRETAFGNGEKQLGFSILRIHVDDIRDNWSKEIATAKAAIKKGAIVFASPWNPPSSMTETVNGKKRLRYDKYAAYAQHLNDFVSYMKENGVDLYAISVQNEPDYAHEWTWWTPEEMLKFMKENAKSINCRVIAPESFQYLKNISDPILNDPTALANMDILGAHLYGTQVSAFPYPLFKQKGAGKDLWMTEVYVPNSEANSADRWPEALDVATHMHNSMVEAEFQAYVWWYIRRSYGPMKEDGTISKRGYMMAHFSKFVRPDYVRVDATKNPNTNVYISAYKGDNKAVIVAINKGTSAVSQKFNVQGAASLSKVTPWVTTGSSNMAAGSSINVSGGSFTAQLPAQSITTYVGELADAATPTPTHTPTPTYTKIPSTPDISVDLNRDGVVNMADVILLATRFNSTKGDSKFVDAYDLTRDGAINMADVIMIAGQFNKSIA